MLVPHSGDYDQLKEDKIEERRHAASKYVFNGETEKAILEYNRIIFLDPNNAKMYAERGNLFIKICDLGSAIANYRKANRLMHSQEYEETLAQLSFIKGLTLIDEGNIQDALTYVDQNLKRDENFHYIKALGYLGSGEKKLAVKELDRYIELVPNTCVEAQLLKGKILWTLGKEYEGNECFWTAFTQTSDHPEIMEFVRIMKPIAEDWHKKAMHAIFSEDWEKALFCCDKGLSIYRENSKLLILKAVIDRKLGNFEVALNDLERASRHMNFEGLVTEVNTQISLTYNEMGQKLFQSKHYNDAITLFNEALSFLPEDSGLFINRGDCYREMNRLETAMADYHKALELGAEQKMLNSRMALLHNSIGVSLYNNKEYAGANVEFSRAIFFNSKIAEFYVNRAKACIEMRTMPQAYEDLDKALKLNPNHQQANVLQQKFKPKTDARTLPANIVKLMARQRTKQYNLVK